MFATGKGMSISLGHANPVGGEDLTTAHLASRGLRRITVTDLQGLYEYFRLSADQQSTFSNAYR